MTKEVQIFGAAAAVSTIHAIRGMLRALPPVPRRSSPKKNPQRRKQRSRKTSARSQPAKRKAPRPNLERKLRMPQSYLKASIDGLNGSGKTGTAARLAVGIAIEYCNHSPVIVYDSEE